MRVFTFFFLAGLGIALLILLIKLKIFFVAAGLGVLILITLLGYVLYED